MINKLSVYVARTVLSTVFIICVALMAVFIIVTFIAQSDKIGEGQFTALTALYYVLLQVPNSLYLILPIGGLLGCLMGLGMLGNNSELIVMRAAGVSVFQLAKGVLYAGIVLAVITFILGAYIGPIASKYAEVTRTIAIHHNSATIGNKENTIWLKQNDNFVHVTAKKNTKQFKNIKRYHFNDLKLDKITYAEKGRYQDAKHWEVKNIDTYTLNANKISHQHSQKQKWHAIIPPEIVKVISKETQNLTLYSLYKIVNYSKAHGKSYAKPALQLWKMFFQPISVIILMLIAVPFSIGQARSSSMGLRFIIGFGIGFLFFLINQFFGPITRVYQIPPFLGASLPTLMFILLLVFLFYRTRD